MQGVAACQIRSCVTRLKTALASNGKCEQVDLGFAPSPDEHVTVKEEPEASEHLPLFDASLMSEGVSQATGEGFAEGHGQASLLTSE